MAELFNEYYNKAEEGKRILESYYKDSKIDESSHAVILVFPDNNLDLLNVVYKYYGIFIKQCYYDEIVIISSVNIDIAYLRKKTDSAIHYYEVDKRNMDLILRFLSVIDGHDAIKVMSLEEPFNRKLRNIVGFKEITVDEIVFYSIYGLLDREVISSE